MFKRGDWWLLSNPTGTNPDQEWVVIIRKDGTVKRQKGDCCEVTGFPINNNPYKSKDSGYVNVNHLKAKLTKEVARIMWRNHHV